jgi:type II secretion system protein N
LKDKIKNSKYFKPLSYVVFFIIIFFFSFYYTLPTDEIRGIIISGIEMNTPFEAKLGAVSIAPIVSVKVQDLELYRGGELYVKLEDVKMRPSLFSLLSKYLRLPFRAKLMSGDVRGNLIYDYKTGQIVGINAKLNGIDVEKFHPIMAGYLGMTDEQLTGKLHGDFSLDFSSETSGVFSLKIDNMGISNFRLIGFPIPPFKDLESIFTGKIEDGVTKVDELSFKGNDFDLNMYGSIPPLWNITEGAKIDLMINLNILSDEAKIGIVRSFLSPKGDGTLGGKILGTFGNPKVVRDTRGQ